MTSSRVAPTAPIRRTAPRWPAPQAAYAASKSAVIGLTATLKRFGHQHELDAAVVFLASDAASYVTGVTLAVDGGMSTH